MTLSEARHKLVAAMDRVTEDHEPLIITRRNGKPAVLISLDDYNAWRETEYLTRSAANAADLLQAVAEVRERRGLLEREPIEE